MTPMFWLVVVAIGVQIASPGVYVDKGACPGEGCQYGERWIAKEAVEVRREPNPKSAGVATVRLGEAVRTVTGEVHTVPGRFVVRVPIRSSGREMRCSSTRTSAKDIFASATTAN